MTKRIDRMLTSLAESPPDHPLDQLEPAVWRRIGDERGPAVERRFLTPLRALAVTAALLSGAAVGGFQAVAARDSAPAGSLTAAGVEWAPSTLLEGRG